MDIKEIQLDASSTSIASRNQNNISYEITTMIDKGKVARFSANNYNHIDHSYAITLHKAQGQTVDWSMIVASKNMDAHATYVALTRYRKYVTIFYDTKTFSDFKELQKSLSRVSNKDLVVDYTIKSEHQWAWENVQEYILLGQDLTALIRENDSKSYQTLKKERNTIGQNILSEWKQHLSYAHQAGLSKESIEIACGFKMRPLSLIEQQAQLTVQKYAKKAIGARLIWREIRKTHPGKNCYDHPKYSEFTNLKQERNDLAEKITNNRFLYKDLITKLGKEIGIGWKNLNNQANQGKYFLDDRLRMSEITIDICKKYNLKIPNHLSEKDFFNHVQKLSNRIPLWNKILGYNPSFGGELKSIENAILAMAMRQDAKKEYCFLSTSMEASIRSEGIACIAANLIQEAGFNGNIRKMLDKAAQVYDNNLNVKSELLLMKSKEKPPIFDKLISLIDEQHKHLT